MDQQGLSVYMLAKQSDLTWNTIDNILKRNGNPTFHTLTMLCKGLGITLLQFFDEDGEVAEITPEQQHYLSKRAALNERDRHIVDSMIDIMLKDK